jgi:hypothetical protein
VSELRVSLGSSFTRASSRSSSACPLNAWRSCGPRTPETLQYDIYFNDDQSECIVLERERYARDPAVQEHRRQILERWREDGLSL